MGRRISEAEEYNKAGDKAAAEGRQNSAEMFYDMAVHSNDTGGRAETKPTQTTPARQGRK